MTIIGNKTTIGTMSYVGAASRIADSISVPTGAIVRIEVYSDHNMKQKIIFLR